jgi:hypothetical protein
MKKVMKLGTSRRCSREMLLTWHFTIFLEGVDEHAKKPIIDGRLGLRVPWMFFSYSRTLIYIRDLPNITSSQGQQVQLCSPNTAFYAIRASG